MNTESSRKYLKSSTLPTIPLIRFARLRKCLLSLATFLSITGTLSATTVSQTFNDITTSGGAVPANLTSLYNLQDHGVGFTSTTFPQNTWGPGHPH